MIMLSMLLIASFGVSEDTYDELTIRFIQDLQGAFNSDWIVIFLKVDSDGFLEKLRILKLRKTLFTYVSVYGSKSFLGLRDEDFYVRTPLILYWHQKGEDLISQFQFLDHFKESWRFVWILITVEDVSSQMETVNIPFNSQFIICRRLNDFKKISMMEIYKTSKNSRLFGDDFGSWTVSSGLNVTSSSFLKRRMNFQKQIILVNGGKDVTGGPFTKLPNYLPDMWKNVEKRLNITSIYTAEKNFDINTYSNTILGPAGDEHEYIHVLFTFKVDLFYKEVGEQLGWATYLYPFDDSAWILIIAWILVTSAFMSFTIHKTPRHKNKKLKPGFSWRIFDVLSILFQQGASFTTDSHSVRMIASLNFLCSMMMFGVYSAVFISFITITIHKPPFDELTLEGVLRQGLYNIVVVRGKSLPFFEKNQHPTVRALFDRQLPPFEEQPITFLEGFQKVCYTPYKYLSEYPPAAIDELRPHLPGCQISQASILINRFQTTWLLKRGSPYKPMIQLSTLKLSESGVIGTNTLWKKLFLRKDLESNNLNPIHMEEVLSLFAAFGLGAALAVLLLTIEIIFLKWKFRSRG